MPTSADLSRIINGLLPLSPSDTDVVEWVPSGNGKLTPQSAKNAITRYGNRVPWYSVVWFKGYVPRLATILWMNYKQRMLTRNKLKEWGCINDDRHVLCAGASENQNHLFFGCPYTNSIWKDVLRRNGMHREVNNWELESAKAIEKTKGGDFKGNLRALSLAATVYMVWKEWNYRIFRNTGQEWFC